MLMRPKILSADQLDEAVTELRRAELVALPTETVYGLAADARNEEAIQKIFIAKGRPSDHPLIVHIESFERAYEWASHISEHAQQLAAHFWPGPLTMVFAKRPEISDLITGRQNTVALRVPKHPLFLSILNKLGDALVAPSANAHQKISPTKPEHVIKSLGAKIAAIVEGGTCSVGIESTIIDMTKDTPVILRPGAVTALMIENVLGIPIECPFSHSEKVPGNMMIHYQPEKPLFLVTRDALEQLAKTETKCAVMHYSNVAKTSTALYYRMPATKSDYAQCLYDTLHRIDNTEVEQIWVEIPPDVIEWSDIHDRLMKASHK
jgi:L-threonylcarbamoyladenylate synthase